MKLPKHWGEVKPIHGSKYLRKPMQKELKAKDMVAFAKKEIAEWTKFLKEFETRTF